MAMDGLTPVVDIGGNGNGGWGDWGGALIGGAIGGAVGSAWGDRRGNNCCNNGGCCNGGGNTAAFGETFIMDSLSGARSDINSIGRDNLMQTAGVQNALCQGFGGVNATVERTALGQQITAAQTRADMQSMLNTILNHMPYKTPTTSGGGTTA